MHSLPNTSNTTSFSSSSRIALLAVGVTVVVWSLSNIAIKFVSPTALVASFYRLWFALPILWFVTLSCPSIRRRLTRDWFRASLVGGTLFGVHQIAFFNSIKLTSVANVVIIIALQPILVLFVANRFFHEKSRFQDIIWSVTALFGVAIEMIGSTKLPAQNLLGDLLAVINLLIFTAYFLYSKKIRTNVGATEYMAGMTTVASIIVTIANIATQQDLASPTQLDFLVLAAVAIVPGTVGHLLINWAHPYTKAFVVSIMMLLIPVLASIGAAILLDEGLNAIQITGGLVVLSSVFMVVRSA